MLGTLTSSSLFSQGRSEARSPHSHTRKLRLTEAQGLPAGDGSGGPDGSTQAHRGGKHPFLCPSSLTWPPAHRTGRVLRCRTAGEHGAARSLAGNLLPYVPPNMTLRNHLPGLGLPAGKPVSTPHGGEWRSWI